MRALEKNKTKAYYALYIGETDLLDENNFITGEKTRTYEPTVPFRANIGIPRGGFKDLSFGRIEKNDRTITDVAKKLPFTGDTLIWIGRATSEVANYKIVATSESLNNRKFLIRERNVNG